LISLPAAGDPSCTGLDGQEKDPTSETWLTPGLTCWSLVGRIGDGAPFQVGTGVSFSVETAGRLYLGANDEIHAFGNNSGNWTVDITVSDALEELSAKWRQWVLSIPVSENPLLDETGEKCHVGQQGPEWFLVGNFAGGQTTRTCTVPEGKVLFFPLINSLYIDTPNVCGQGPSIPVEELRATIASHIDGATELSVEVDGKPIADLRRVQSKVFTVTLPEENVFDEQCAEWGGVPAGVYSPAVDDGYYVRLSPLAVGDHTLRIRSKNPSMNFTLDVTYKLTVAPVSLK
jgi:hypothetical protein